MNYWILVDIILASIFVGIVYLVARNGLIKTLAFLLACAIAAVGSYHLTKRTWEWGSEKIFTPLCEKAITLVLGDPEESETYEYLDSVVDTLEKAMDKVMEKLSENKEGEEEEPSIIAVNPDEEEEAEKEKDKRTAVEKISSAIGKYVSMVVLFWIFFSLILALLRLAIDELNFIERVPIVGRVNQILGILLGLLIAFAVLAAPIYVLQKVLGELDLFDMDKLSNSFVITKIADLLAKIR